MFSASKISISLPLVIRPAGSWTSYSSARARRAFTVSFANPDMLRLLSGERRLWPGLRSPFSCRIIGHADIIRQ